MSTEGGSVYHVMAEWKGKPTWTSSEVKKAVKNVDHWPIEERAFLRNGSTDPCY